MYPSSCPDFQLPDPFRNAPGFEVRRKEPLLQSSVDFTLDDAEGCQDAEMAQTISSESLDPHLLSRAAELEACASDHGGQG